MSRSWSRRALLAGLGAVPLAGCATDPARQPTPTPTETRPQPETPSNPPTPSELATPSEPATPSETETPDGDPEPPASLDSAWPVPGHDAGRSNAAADAEGPTERVGELWRVTADAALSDPVVADGTVYVGGGDGAVRALDARTGAERWRRPVGTAAFTPRAMDGHLYVPVPDGVVALDAADGTGLWRAATPNRADDADAVAEERVAVLVASHGVYWLSGGETPAVVGLSPADGSERWRTGIAPPWTSRLFAGEESVFVSTGSRGGTAWRLAADTGAVVDRPSEAVHDARGERFHRAGTVYAVSGFWGQVEAIPVAPGGHDWFRRVPGGPSVVSGGADRVYLGVTRGSSTGVHALSATDGTTEWSAGAAPTARPVVAAGSVLVRTDDALRCLDPTDGSELWTRPADGVGDRVVVADDVVYTARDGAVRALRPP